VLNSEQRRRRHPFSAAAFPKHQPCTPPGTRAACCHAPCRFESRRMRADRAPSTEPSTAPRALCATPFLSMRPPGPCRLPHTILTTPQLVVCMQ
jgi:hypothetical protein